MISPRHTPIHTQSSPNMYVARVPTSYLLARFEPISSVEDPEPNWRFDPSDINFTSELRCPNCDQFSADSICICGATIQHPDTGELP